MSTIVCFCSFVHNKFNWMTLMLVFVFCFILFYFILFCFVLFCFVVMAIRNWARSALIFSPSDHWFPLRSLANSASSLKRNKSNVFIKSCTKRGRRNLSGKTFAILLLETLLHFDALFSLISEHSLCTKYLDISSENCLSFNLFLNIVFHCQLQFTNVTLMKTDLISWKLFQFSLMAMFLHDN